MDNVCLFETTDVNNLIELAIRLRIHFNAKSVMPLNKMPGAANRDFTKGEIEYVVRMTNESEVTVKISKLDGINWKIVDSIDTTET